MIITFLDHLLRNREQVVNDINDADKINKVTTNATTVFLILTLIYGLIMGSQSLLHGGKDGFIYMIGSGVKLPLLFLLTLCICLPLFYVLNVLIGVLAHFKVVFGLLITSLAVTSIMLAACAPIVLFFMLSTYSYAFIVVLNVFVFTISGFYGVWYLSRMMSILNKNDDNQENPRSNTKTLISWWLFAYGIVGTQMAWIMRPFIGNPEISFTFFRPQESNFYISVFRMIWHILGG